MSDPSAIQRVETHITGGIAEVVLNRPEKMNALDPAMFTALAAAGEALKTDLSVRAVVLRGAGRAFCAGLDFASFEAMAKGPDRGRSAGAGGPDPVRGDDAPGDDGGGDVAGLGVIGEVGDRITHLAQQVAWVWQEVPVPVIAAVHGVALGGGCQIALGADVRIAAPDARLAVLELQWGLIPDMTGTWLLPRIVGPDVAAELVYTARMVDAAEALRIGLVTRIAPDPVAAAHELAARIADQSPHAVRAAKRLLRASSGHDAATHFAAEREEIGRLVGSPNQREAVAAGLAKRTGTYADPVDPA